MAAQAPFLQSAKISLHDIDVALKVVDFNYVANEVVRIAAINNNDARQAAYNDLMLQKQSEVLTANPGLNSPLGKSLIFLKMRELVKSYVLKKEYAIPSSEEALTFSDNHTSMAYGFWGLWHKNNPECTHIVRERLDVDIESVANYALPLFDCDTASFRLLKIAATGDYADRQAAFNKLMFDRQAKVFHAYPELDYPRGRAVFNLRVRGIIDRRVEEEICSSFNLRSSATLDNYNFMSDVYNVLFHIKNANNAEARERAFTVVTAQLQAMAIDSNSAASSASASAASPSSAAQMSLSAPMRECVHHAPSSTGSGLQSSGLPSLFLMSTQAQQVVSSQSTGAGAGDASVSAITSKSASGTQPPAPMDLSSSTPNANSNSS